MNVLDHFTLSHFCRAGEIDQMLILNINLVTAQSQILPKSNFSEKKEKCKGKKQ